MIVSKYGSLEVYSVAYRPGNKIEVTPSITKIIRRGVSPEKALSNAKSSIMSRLQYFDKIREMKESQKVATPEQFNHSPLEEIVQIDNPEELEEIEGIKVLGIAS